MKLYKKTLFTFILLSLMLVGCQKFDGSLNVDPNSPTKASGTQLIANSQFYLSGLNSSTSPYGVHYPQYLSSTTFTDNSRYTAINFNFYGLYTGPLMNLEKVISGELSANEGPIVNQIAVAKILKAYFMWHITDRWGDVPFSEALKGEGNFTPKYDTQKEIYVGLFTLLKEADVAIVTGNIKNDIMYSGDLQKWKKLGNTIRLLMALRLSKVDPVLGKVEFQNALNAGIMVNNNDNFVYPHLSEADHENSWYTSFTRLGRNWFALSKPLVDYMKPLADPRLPIFGDPKGGGDYVGLEYGKTGSVDVANFSLLGSSLRKQNSPIYLVTYAQTLFAQAEAAKLGWISGSDAEAKINYDLGIRNSIAQWNNGDVSALSAFMNQPEVAYNPADALKLIAYQRWVHLFLNGYEAWAEWRRTGYPILVAAPGANGDKIPRREGYPTQEPSRNGQNYDKAVASFPYGGTDDLNARVWWDKP